MTAHTSQCDPKFLDRLRRGESAAFDKMVELESPQLSRLVSRLLGWDSDVDDVVQSVLMDAWVNLGKFRNQSTLRTWLGGIAINKCRNVQRRRRIWNRCFGVLVERWKSVDEMDALDSEAETEDVTRIYAAIRKLRHIDREIIVLCCLEQKPLDEVTLLLNIEKNTAEVRLHRARKRLKELLDHE